MKLMGEQDGNALKNDLNNRELTLTMYQLKVPIMPGQLLFFLKVRRLKLKKKFDSHFFSRLYRPSNPPVNPENPQQQGDWVRVML